MDKEERGENTSKDPTIPRMRSHVGGFHLDFAPTEAGQEAGAALFLAQYNHADLGVVALGPCNGTDKKSVRSLRVRATAVQESPATPVLERRIPDN